MPLEHYIALAYDIENDRRRSKVADFLEGYAQRVQKSVFETILEDTLATQMIDGVRELLASEDGFRIYRMPAARENGLTIIGGLRRVEFPRLIIA